METGQAPVSIAVLGSASIDDVDEADDSGIPWNMICYLSHIKMDRNTIPCYGAKTACLFHH